VIGDWLRSFLQLEGDLVGRQRVDLGLENYFYLPVRASLNAEIAPWEEVSLALGGGIEQRFFFDVSSDGSMSAAALDAATQQHYRLFAGGRLELLFNPSELRKDRRDRLRLEGRYYGEGNDGSERVIALGLDWIQVYEIGWDELRFEARADLRLPRAPFYQQFGLGERLLRLAYDDVYAERAASLGVEYRLSLSRDIVKLSVFNEALLMAELPGSPTELRFVDSVGLGVHFLFIDTFQLNFYGGLGFASRGEPVDFGFTLSILQVF
jgi:hypothetical protein